MREYTLRILHISDIHFRGAREKEHWRRRRVLGHAWDRNLDELQSDGPLDMVCLTGDVANSGKPDEYEEASNFVDALLSKIGIGKERLFVVPGNHDIDRTISNSAWNALRQHLSSASALDVSRWFAGGKSLPIKGMEDTHRDEVILRQQAYRDWVRERLGRVELLPQAAQHPRLGYRATLTLPDLPFPVHVIGLDSAWLAGDEHDSEKLRLTEDQVMRLAANEDGSQLDGFRLALVHHPLHSLADHRDCQHRLAEHVDLLLRGHLHEEDVSAEFQPGQVFRQLSAGCLYEGSGADTYPNSCHKITLALDERGRPRHIDLRLRSFSPKGGHWHDDASRTPLAPAGRLRWSLASGEKGDVWEDPDAPPTAEPGSVSTAIPFALAGPLPDEMGYEPLLDGLRTMPAGRDIRRFFAAYLGAKDQPEPFGGRAAEMTTLHQWLDTPAESPCMVLVAPAGCGKSALLCRFCIQVAKRPDVAVVFFPISIRYQTNLESKCLPVIVSRLRHLHGEAPQQLDQTSPAQWRSLLDQYLERPLPDGRKLLLVLDGLDEADDWRPDHSLFPRHPSRNLRILVAARAGTDAADVDGWRHRLGWGSAGVSRAMTLAGLDVNGVAEALRSLGMPIGRMAERSEMVVQLHRLSDGAPLLVRLWCHRIMEQGAQALDLTPENLRGYPPGLAGYLQEFWESRRKTEKEALRHQAKARLVLEILSLALGPLRKEEMLSLAPEISGWPALQEALAPLSRLVVGDGEAHGYVLTHSLLRDYFRDKEMLPADRRERARRFLCYGHKTLADLTAGQLAPAEVPPYLLQYYGSHLHNAGGAPELWLPLVSNAWRRAWEDPDGGARGFLHDVYRAWDAFLKDDTERLAQGQPSRWLAELLRCAMCIATVKTIQNGIYYRLVELLVHFELWSVRQALAYVQQMTDNDSPSGTRRTLFGYLLPRLPDDLLLRAMDIALEFASSRWGTSEPLVAMAERLAKTHPYEAVAAARGLRHEWMQIEVLAALAKHLAEPQRASLMAELLRRVRALPHPWGRSSWLQKLALHFPEGERQAILLEALDEAKRIEKASDRVTRLRELFPLLPKRVQARVLKSLFDAAYDSDSLISLPQALEAIEGLGRTTQQKILRQVLTHPGGPDAVIRWVDASIHPAVIGQLPPDRAARWQNLKKLLSHEEIEALIERRLDGLEGENAGATFDWLCWCVAPQLSPRVLAKVVDIFQRSSLPWLPARGFCELAPYVPPELALQGLSRLMALEWTRDFSCQRELARVFESLSIEQFEAAVAIVEKAEHAQCRAWGLAYALWSVRDDSKRPALLNSLQAAALAIPSHKERASMLLEILPTYPGERQRELFHACLQATNSIGSGYERISMLCKIARKVIQPYRDHLLRRALEEMPKLEQHYRRTAFYDDILRTPEISDALKSEALDEALRVIRAPASGLHVAMELTDISNYAPPEMRPELIREAFHSARRLDGRGLAIMMAAKLGPSTSWQRRLLDSCGELASQQQRGLLLNYLWPNLDESLKPEAVRLGLAVMPPKEEDETAHLTELITWIGRSSGEQRQQLVSAGFEQARELLSAHREPLFGQAELAADEEGIRKRASVSSALQHALAVLCRDISVADCSELVDLIPPTWWTVRAAIAQKTGAPRWSELLQELLAEPMPDQQRGMLLAELLAYVPADERARVIQEALRNACIVWESAHTYRDSRAQVLTLVAPYVQAEHLPLIAGLLQSLHSQQTPFTGLANLLLLLHEPVRSLVVDDLLGRIKSYPEQLQERILVACAAWLPPADHQRLVPAIPRHWDQHNARLSETLKPQLSDSQIRLALRCTLTANGELPSTDAQLLALSYLGSESLRRNPTEAKEVFSIALSLLKGRTDNLAHFQSAVESLSPLFRQLVSPQEADRIVEALLDVGAWWR